MFFKEICIYVFSSFILLLPRILRGLLFPILRVHVRRRSTLVQPFTYLLTCALHGEITVSSLKPLRISADLFHKSVRLNVILFSQTVIITNYCVFILTIALQRLNQIAIKGDGLVVSYRCVLARNRRCR